MQRRSWQVEGRGLQLVLSCMVVAAVTERLMTAVTVAPAVAWRWWRRRRNGW